MAKEKDYEKDYQNSILRTKIGLQNRQKKNETSSNLKEFWKSYCLHSTVHCIKYVAAKNLYKFERIIWLFIMLSAILFASYFSYLISFNFLSDVGQTRIEKLYHSVSEIPFPAVTICNRNRINWNKIDGAIEKFLPPNSTEDVIDLFKKFISKFEILQFGFFEGFEEFRNVSLEPLDSINLENVAEYMAHDCQEIFSGKCWWINKFHNCCDIFVRQYSEHGICHAFNSVVNSVGRRRIINESNWPWRTTGYAEWSGLRFDVHISHKSKPPESYTSPGAIIVIHHPLEWPMSKGTFVPAGTRSAVILTPKYSYLKDDTKAVPFSLRGCYFPDEVLDFKNKTGLTYLQNNCMSQCRQNYLLHYCNCSITFLYPATLNHAQCKASDYKCLEKHDTILNYEKPPDANPYFNNNEEGMVCKCLLECHAIDYKMTITSFAMTEANEAHQIIFDIHFQSSKFTTYQTDMDYDWMDLLVSFGGIAGLCMGSSIISAVELFYFLLIGLGFYLKMKYKKYFNKDLQKDYPKTKSIKKQKPHKNEFIERKSKF